MHACTHAHTHINAHMYAYTHACTNSLIKLCVDYVQAVHRDKWPGCVPGGGEELISLGREGEGGAHPHTVALECVSCVWS